MPVSALIQTFRPPFLLLIPAVLLLAFGLAHHSGQPIDVMAGLLVALAALAAHISVNTLNEYEDFTSGLDHLTQRTPFSGGSGALPAYPTLARSTLVAGLTALILSIAIGLYLALARSPLLLLFGATGVLLVVGYTRWINRQPWLSLISPGAGFGLIMVLGSKLALSGSLQAIDGLLALTPFFLVNNLLLLNQYPDIEADRLVGRRTPPIAFGTDRSNRIYLLFVLLAYLPIPLLALSGDLPVTSLVALLPLPLALMAWKGATRHGPDIGHHPAFLAMNVAATLLTPSLLGLSLLMS